MTLKELQEQQMKARTGGGLTAYNQAIAQYGDDYVNIDFGRDPANPSNVNDPNLTYGKNEQGQFYDKTTGVILTNAQNISQLTRAGVGGLWTPNTPGAQDSQVTRQDVALSQDLALQEQAERNKPSPASGRGYGENISPTEAYRLRNPGKPTLSERTPTRNPGEAIEDFTSRIDPKSYQMTPQEAAGGAAGLAAYNQRIASLRGTSGAQSPVSGASGGIGGASTPYSPTVATSTALRAKDKMQEIKDMFGLGDAPVLPDIFGSTDQKSLDLARKERDAINKELESILAERLEIDAEFRKFQENAGEGVTEAGRAGITSEEGRKVQEQYDALNRRELVLETKLNNRNSVIKELMGAQQLEYSQAVDQYNTRFSQALQLYQIFDAEEDELRQNAKANLEVLAQSIQAQIEAGKITPDAISSVQRQQIAELELQSGLPQGSTLAVLQSLKPGEEKLYSGVDDEGTFTLITKDASGNIVVKKSEGAVYVPPGSGTGGDDPPPTSTAYFTSDQQKKLVEHGVDLITASQIYEALISGASLDEVRQALRALGKDPALLDKFDRATGNRTIGDLDQPDNQSGEKPEGQGSGFGFDDY